MKSVKQQQGFTIIELVVVILLLGILTATALPRFLDVTDEAHDAVIDGVRSGLQTGAALYRAQWIGQAQPDSLNYDGATLNAQIANGSDTPGYPIGSDATFNDAADCVAVYNGLLQSGRPPAGQTATASAAAISTATDTLVNGEIPAFIAAFTATLDGTNDGCSFYYTGQYQDPLAGRTLPILTYVPVTGVVALAATEFTFEP